MRPLVPLASLLCLLAACASDIDAGANNGGAGGTSPGAGGTLAGLGGTGNQAGDGGSSTAGSAPGSGSAGDGVGGLAGDGGNTPAGSGGTSGAGAPGNGGAPGDAGNGGTAGTGAIGTTKYVSLSIGSNGYKKATVSEPAHYNNSGRASVTFKETSGVPTGCTETIYGDCHLLACAPTAGLVSVPVPVDLGDIIFTGAKISPLALVRHPDDDEYLTLVAPEGQQINQQGQLLGYGAPIRVTGGGIDTPAFDLLVEAPSVTRVSGIPATITPNGGTAEIDTTQDLNLTIHEGTVGEFYTFIFAGNESGYTSLVCQTPASAPSQVIPAVALARLKETASPGTNNIYRTEVLNQTASVIGEWQFHLLLTSPIRDENWNFPNSTLHVQFK